MWMMLIATMWAREAVSVAPGCFVLMAGYVIYDHADGMHSRRTGTSSPLGEYLDHFTDIFHGAISVVVMFLIAGRAGSPLMLGVLWAVLLAGAATMAEERERGELFFGLIGPLEGMLLTFGFFASWCWSGAAAWWHAPLVGGWTVFECVMISGAAGSVLTAVACARRIKRVPAGLALYALTGTSVCVAGWYAGWPWWATALVMTLHGADFTGRVIAGHLRGTKRPSPDWIAPVVMVAWVAAGWPAVVYGVAAGTYLAVRVAGNTFGMFRVFGRHWRWLNLPAAV
jgi:ethanolaminephosphotransferase